MAGLGVGYDLFVLNAEAEHRRAIVQIDHPVAYLEVGRAGLQRDRLLYAHWHLAVTHPYATIASQSQRGRP